MNRVHNKHNVMQSALVVCWILQLMLSHHVIDTFVGIAQAHVYINLSNVALTVQECGCNKMNQSAAVTLEFKRHYWEMSCEM